MRGRVVAAPPRVPLARTAKKWTMPEWMAPYRKVLEQSAYGLGVEDLMNDHDSTFFNNAYRAAVCVGLKEAVFVLTRLHQAGLLASNDGGIDG